jgi:hypothetical protein
MLRSIWNGRAYQSVALKAVYIVASKAWQLKGQHIRCKAYQGCLS